MEVYTLICVMAARTATTDHQNKATASTTMTIWCSAAKKHINFNYFCTAHVSTRWHNYSLSDHKSRLTTHSHTETHTHSHRHRHRHRRTSAQRHIMQLHLSSCHTQKYRVFAAEWVHWVCSSVGRRRKTSHKNLSCGEKMIPHNPLIPYRPLRVMSFTHLADWLPFRRSSAQQSLLSFFFFFWIYSRTI